MDIQEIRNNLELLPDRIYELEKDYLEHKAQLNYMDDLTKHLIAKWKGDFTGANTERERQALARKEYLNHIQGKAALAVDVAQAAADFHKEERFFEAMRSLNKNI